MKVNNNTRARLRYFLPHALEKMDLDTLIVMDTLIIITYYYYHMGWKNDIVSKNNIMLFFVV